MIQVSCSACGKLYRVPEQFAGKKTRCKNCSAIISIPEVSAAPAPAGSATPSEGVAPAAAAEAPPSAPEPAPSEAPAEPAPKEAKPAGPRTYGKPKFPSGKVFPKAAGAKKAGAGVPVGKKFAIPKKTFGSAKFARTRAPRASAAKTQAPGGEEEAVPAGGGRQTQFIVLGGAVVLLALLVVALSLLGFLPWPFGQPKAPPKLAKRPAVPEAVEKEGAPSKAEASPSEAAAPESASTAAPDDPLALVPARANFLAYIAFGRLQNLPLVGAKLAELLKDEKAAEFMEATGFDPRSNLESVWFAGEAKGAEESGESSGIVILEGSFEKETFLNGLKEKSIVTGGPRTLGGLEVYPLDASQLGARPEESREAYLAFLSERRVLLGDAEFFNEAMKLRSGGENIRKDKFFASLTGDFSTEKVAWLALKIPKGFSVEKILSGPSGLGPFPGAPAALPPGMEGVPKEGPGESLESEETSEETEASSETEESSEESSLEEEEASGEDEKPAAPSGKPAKEKPPATPGLELAEQMPSLDAVFFSLDSQLDGSLAVELTLRGASPEEGAKTRKLLASLIVLARASVPKEYQPLLNAIKFQSQKETVRVNAVFSPDLLEQLEAMLPAAKPGLEPGEESEEEEAGMEGEEETAEPEEEEPAEGETEEESGSE